jgi:hypothetical protein
MFEFGHGSMILAELCPFYYENNMKFSVSVHYLPNVLQIQLKLDIWVCHENVQVKFELGHGSW